MVKKERVFALLAFSVFVMILFVGCGKPAETVKTSMADGSEDLVISYQLNLKEADVENNFFTFKGNIRYLAADKDQADMVTGASMKGSTHVFQGYLYDIEGKYTMSGGLRGLFLYGVNQKSAMITDGLDVAKAADGVITVQYAHRGTAYRIITDASGNLDFPMGTFQKRAIGYIVGGGPQVISKDFSVDGTSATIDWLKVWDSSVASGVLVDTISDKKTGSIVKDAGDPASMYYYDGTLKAAINSDILTIQGSLTAVSR